MLIKQTILLAILIIYLGFTSCSGPKTYYISATGDDSNTGLSVEQAWQSIQRVNDEDFAPGDLVLFRGGDEFTGTLYFSAEDAGTASSRLVVSSFGKGKAIISGQASEAIRADSCRYLTIESLDCRGSGRKSGNTTDGLLLYKCNDITITDIEVRGFQHSGIHLHKCNDAVIRLVHAHDNGFAGIHVSGTTIWDSVNYDNHNLYIAYCVAENNPGDPTVLKNHSGNGILASSVKGGIIEYCEASNNGWDMPWTENGPVGIWIWDCTDFIIQHCISHHNRTNPLADDGGGFDLDGGVSNSVIQYCISHNNEGAGFGLYEFGATKPWENNTLRYNISQNDGIINGASIGIWKNDKQGIMRNCLIYNNTFYNSLEKGSNIWLYDHYPGYHFYNNVFVHNGSLLSEKQTLKDEVFQGNLYWNLNGEESFLGHANLRDWAMATGKEMQGDELLGIFRDPLLKEAGSISVTEPLKINRASIAGYIPRSESSLVDMGLDLKTMLNLDVGEKDLLGNVIPINNNYDIGAIEFDD